MERKKILFVDDEPQVIHALKRDFRKSSYQTFFALSGKEGLEILEKEEIDLVVADMKMPEMDGYEFLRQVKIKYPEIICIILSGYTESEAVYQALVNGTARAYLCKPWERETLQNYIDQLFAIKRSLEDKQLLQIVNSVSYLPTLGKHYQKILNLIAAGEDLGKIAEVIEEDPALTIDVLKVANSAFYGQRMPIASVKRAVVLLGLNVIKDIVLSLGILNSFKKFGKVSIEIEKFWEHANLCNKMIGFLYDTFFNQKLPEEFSAVGLLHDVGKLFILAYFPEKFFQIIKEIKKYPEMSLKIEKEIIGVPHTLLGGYLLNWWNLPYPIIEVAIFHHEPNAPGITNKKINALVHIADFYSYKILNVEPYYYLIPEAFDILEIKKEEIEEKIEEFSNKGKINAAAS